MQICILKLVSNCFQGSQSKWRGGNIDDGSGAAMPFILEESVKFKKNTQYNRLLIFILFY